MSKNPLARPAVLALVLANFIPLWGVIYRGWDVANVLHLYWLENVAFGLITLLRLFTNRYPESRLRGRMILALFFTVHYGAFCCGHALFVFGGLIDSGEEGAATSELVLNFLKGNWHFLLVFFLSHFVSFIWNYHGKGEATRMKPNEIVILPYRRIMVLHVTIVLGGMAVLALGSSAALVGVLVLAKTAGDLVLHFREHRGA